MPGFIHDPVELCLRRFQWSGRGEERIKKEEEENEKGWRDRGRKEMREEWKGVRKVYKKGGKERRKLEGSAYVKARGKEKQMAERSI